MQFLDTNVLLDELQNVFKTEEKICISNLTLKELEGIKTSYSKDPDIKFKARQVLKLLADNKDKYEIMMYLSEYDEDLKQYPVLSDNIDSRIILSAFKKSAEEDVTFVTSDLNCAFIAEAVGLKVRLPKETNDEYKGFRTVRFNDLQLSTFYSNLGRTDNKFKMLINEYLFIEDMEGNIIDKYKWTEEGFKQVRFNAFNSKMFGQIKPKDEYQMAAMDSLKSNQITMLRGSAGTGKSWLSFGYLFECLESGKIDRIIIFCNTVATFGSAKLGFYPGSRTEKLLDSQIGNLLESKLGSRMMVEKMIEEGQLVLLPMSDIRGYDTSGLNAGIYISEAQNLDIELMKLALQRIGEDSICILDGDDNTQVDLAMYAGNRNGMKRVSEVYKDHDFFGEVTLQNIYRSRIAKLAEKL